MWGLPSPTELMQYDYGEKQRSRLPSIPHHSSLRSQGFFPYSYNKPGSEPQSLSNTTWLNTGKSCHLTTMAGSLTDSVQVCLAGCEGWEGRQVKVVTDEIWIYSSWAWSISKPYKVSLWIRLKELQFLWSQLLLRQWKERMSRGLNSMSRDPSLEYHFWWSSPLSTTFAVGMIS